MASANEVRAFYDEFTFRVFRRDFVRSNVRQVAAMDLVRRQLRPGMRVLEVGCGAGLVTREIAAMGCRVTAVDIGPRNVELTRFVCAGMDVSTFECDITSEALPDGVAGEYDAIVLADVIEHIPSDRRPAALARLSSLLASGGRLVLTFPSIEYQRHLRENDPAGLQIVDEDVDPLSVASESGLLIRHLEWVDAWRVNQYVHLVLERNAVRPVHDSGGKGRVGSVAKAIWLLRGLRTARAMDAWRQGHPLPSGGRSPCGGALPSLFWLAVGIGRVLRGR